MLQRSVLPSGGMVLVIVPTIADFRLKEKYLEHPQLLWWGCHQLFEFFQNPIGLDIMQDATKVIFVPWPMTEEKRAAVLIKLKQMYPGPLEVMYNFHELTGWLEIFCKRHPVTNELWNSVPHSGQIIHPTAQRSGMGKILLNGFSANDFPKWKIDPRLYWISLRDVGTRNLKDLITVQKIQAVIISGQLSPSRKESQQEQFSKFLRSDRILVANANDRGEVLDSFIELQLPQLDVVTIMEENCPPLEVPHLAAGKKLLVALANPLLLEPLVNGHGGNYIVLYGPKKIADVKESKSPKLFRGIQSIIILRPGLEDIHVEIMRKQAAIHKIMASVTYSSDELKGVLSVMMQSLPGQEVRGMEEDMVEVELASDERGSASMADEFTFTGKIEELPQFVLRFADFDPMSVPAEIDRLTDLVQTYGSDADRSMIELVYYAVAKTGKAKIEQLTDESQLDEVTLLRRQVARLEKDKSQLLAKVEDLQKKIDSFFKLRS